MSGSPCGRAAAKTDALASPTGGSDEEALVARARAGDTAAFGQLVQSYQDRAFGLALRVTRSREDAEEVAQEAFVRAWRALPQFRGDSRFSTWLYRIVARRALDVAQARRGRDARAIDLEAVAATLEAPAPAGGSERRSDLEPLHAALPEAQRLAITLYYYEGRSVVEVARTMGLPDGTVKTHLHRARAALRKALLRAQKEPGRAALRRV
jgi:RNA polymerase sigma-70 factor (ECF subfamily)